MEDKRAELAKKFESTMSMMLELSEDKISQQKKEVTEQLESVKNLCSEQIDRAKNEIAASLQEAKKIAIDAKLIKDASIEEIKKVGESAKKDIEKVTQSIFAKIADIEIAFKKSLDEFKTSYIARTDQALKALSDEVCGTLPLVHSINSRGKRLAQGLETLSRSYLTQDEKE